MENLIEKLSKPIDDLTRKTIKDLLHSSGDLQKTLFTRAREVRDAHKVNFCLLRGVIEISNYCSKNCSYCAMYAQNKFLRRFRMTTEEILQAAESIHNKGITTFFLQSGQDTQMDEIILDVIPKIKKKFSQNILLCVGEKSAKMYQKFYSAGANSYILKFETSDKHLFEKITMSKLKRRIECIEELKKIGFKIGVGNIIGMPNQTIDSIIDDIFLIIKLNPDFVSTAPFIPNQFTPFVDHPYGDLNLTLNWMAIMRILLKTCLIPSVSALEKIHQNGQLMGLNAGANVITINFTPSHYRENYNIYSQERFIVNFNHALETASQANLNIILK